MSLFNTWHTYDQWSYVLNGWLGTLQHNDDFTEWRGVITRHKYPFTFHVSKQTFTTEAEAQLWVLNWLQYMASIHPSTKGGTA